MPTARIAIRHLDDETEMDGKTTRVKGFRILVTQPNIQWAVFAIYLTDKLRYAWLFCDSWDFPKYYSISISELQINLYRV